MAEYTVSSGVTSTGMILKDRNSMFVFSGGTANNTTVSARGYLYIFSGGIANSTLVKGIIASGGYLHIDSGGTANNTTVSSGGYLYLSSGGIANSTTVFTGGDLYVSSGGIANSTTVFTGGYLYIVSGGIVNNPTVFFGGSMWVASGGTTTITFNPWQGTIKSDTGAKITYLERDDNVYFGGKSVGVVSKADAMDSLHLDSGYSAIVYSGGTVNRTVISRGGYLNIYSGGTATEIVENGGYVYVANGALATYASTTINGLYLNEEANIHSGTTAINTTVNSWGCLYVSSGGIANCTMLNTWGRLYVYSGGTANSTTVFTSGDLYVSSGGTANSTTVSAGGYLNIASGGTANSTTISAGGYLNIASGGTAIGIQWTPCNGTLWIEDGAFVTYASLPDGVFYGGDGALSSNAMIMENITAMSGQEMYVMSNGVANSTTVSSGARLIVSCGGTANNNTIYSNGYIKVASGGTAAHIVAISGARLDLVVAPSTYIEGENANSAFEIKDGSVSYYSINAGNTLRISSGGVASRTYVYSGGNLQITNGGAANLITVNSCGSMYIGSGGTATKITENGGYVNVDDGANATFTPNTISGLNLSYLSATVHSGTTANNTRVNSGGYFDVYGGTANSNTVSSGGTLRVSSGGIANSNTVSTGGYMHVGSGGTANSTTVNFSGSTYISSGGTLYVSFGGIANSTTVNSSGIMYVSSGGTANITTVNYKGSVRVAPGGTANSTTVNSSGFFHVSSGGVVNFTKVNYCGTLMVSSGGTANSTSVNSSGIMYVSSGGTANSTSVNSIGRMYVSSGGTANSTTVFTGGIFSVAYGGTASDVVVETGAHFDFVIAPETYIAGMYDGSAFEIKTGVGNNLMVKAGGNMRVYSGGTANNTTASNGGNLNVYSGGIANNTTVFNGGYLYVYGIANNTMVNYKGSMRVWGTVTDVRINSGGIVTIEDSGKLTGKIAIENGGEIHAGQGAVIDFDISRLAPRMGVLLNNLSLIQADAPAFTLTVSDLQWNGTYKLAQGVTEFDNLISVKSTANQTIHMVAVDETVNVDGIEYALKLTGDTLSVTVTGGRDIPIIPVAADITTPTKKDVTLTASYSDAAVMREYSFDNETWYVYDEPVTCSENGTVYFLGKDQRGFVNEIASYEVTNIANRPPDDPVVKPDITAPTNTDVLVSATFEEDAIGEYSFDGETWQTYTGAVRFEQNGTVFFRARDDMDNESEVVSYEVKNIDRIKPVITLDGNTQTPVQQTTLTAATDDGSAILYRINNSGEWMTYTGTIAVLANASYSFKATDAAGNMGTAVITFENIDTTPPVLTLTADTVTLSNSVTLTAETNEETVISYSSDNKNWTTYESPLEVKANGMYYFKAVDVAGNVDNAEIEFTNIDAVAPTAPTGLRSFVDGQDVALVWNVSTDDTGVKEYVVTYSLGGEEFTVRTSGTSYVLKDADYGTWSWSVQAVDFAGNESAIVAGNAFTISGFKPYTVEYSADNFEHVIRFAVTTPTLDSFRMPTGTYQLRVRQEGSSEWVTGDAIVAAEFDSTPQLIKSDADGNADVFFANPVGTWESCYVAQHVGSINDWAGTNEFASVFGKNKLADIIEGSTDANILLMTDDENGDTLFVDDVYTVLPGTIKEQQARIAQIDEIRAGAGNDIVDMTSQQFEYIGDGLTIRGGEGNDVIWANKGDNWLFGDAGNDRLVGASGNDVIAGGIGNDRIHGGGGDDVFTFCDNWGVDNVEQLATGSVTLWFASGSIDNWDEATLTYTDGDNSVKVSGVAAEKVTLKFGDDGSAQFASLTSMGAFFDSTTERIFEESGKGMLASL